MPFLIIEVAGKHYSTTDSSQANTLVINEIEIFKNNGEKAQFTVQDISQTGGNFSNLPVWDNNGIWGKQLFTDGDKSYSQSSSVGIINQYNATADVNMFRRFTISLNENLNQIGNISIWIGGEKFRLPKQISVYFCDSYDVNLNLQNRSNENLTLIDTKNISKTLINPTAIEFLSSKFHTYII